MPRATGDAVRAARIALETDRLFGLTAYLRPTPGSAPAALEEVPTATLARKGVSDASTLEPDRKSPAAGLATTLFIPAPRTEDPGTIDPAERQAALDALRERHDLECPHCTTASGHTRTVFGEGNPNAPILFVGEAPGETEDLLGRPFVGKAGQKLDEMISAMGFARSDVYIANVLKSRPPNNRTPLEHEVSGCGPYLIEQIRIIRPRVLVSLGGPASKLLLGTDVGITRLRGIWAEFRAGGLNIPVIPTFHPAYLLRNYTLETRRQVWHDLQAVSKFLATA